MSGAGKPLALAFALLGRLSVWLVLLPLCGQLSLLAVCWRLTLTCHHLEVVESGKRKAGQGGSAKPLSSRVLLQGNAYAAEGESPSISIATDNLERQVTQDGGQSLLRPIKMPSQGWMLSHGFRPFPPTDDRELAHLHRCCGSDVWCAASGTCAHTAGL